MFLLDDLLLAPLRGVIWVAEKIDDALAEAMDSEEAEIKTAISELYRDIEAGRISEDEFDEREARLLDRLEAFSASKEEEELDQADEPDQEEDDREPGEDPPGGIRTKTGHHG